MVKNELKNVRLQYARWEDLPGEVQDLFVTCMSGDRAQGRVFYQLYFCWYNVAHELGHVLRAQYQDWSGRVWEEENAVNQFAVAFWRAKGQANPLFQLERLVRQALTNLPDPVPIDQDRAAYLDAHYQELGAQPAAYAHFQFTIVRACLERPLIFSEALRTLISSQASDGTTIPLSPDFPLDDELPFRTVEDLRKTVAAYGLELPDIQVICMYSPALQFVLWDGMQVTG